MIAQVIILGASGDLTGRYLLPALATLHRAGLLPAGVRILGVARDDWTPEDFRKRMEARLGSAGGDAGRALLERLDYRRADVAAADQLSRALAGCREPALVYLALPPFLFRPVLETLGRLDLPRATRIVVEKPFGEDLESARGLNRLLHESFRERNVYRIDHFLHQQTVQNILGLRFANRIFEPIWNFQHIARVRIVWDETLTLEGRAGYYDRTGALKDMVQNHLLQLLALIAMEPPRSLDERDLRDRKADALRAVTALRPEEVAGRSRRAWYRAGRIGDRAVPDYAQEPGVDPGRRTETFAEVLLTLDNWRWAGVPFCLRTGKSLGADRQEICVEFRAVPHLAFGQAQEPTANVLRLTLNPDAISLAVNLNGPGDPFRLDTAMLNVTLGPQDLPPYARALLSIMEGNPVLSIRDDEAEESWRILDPVLKAWQAPEFPFLEYAAGSEGPANSLCAQSSEAPPAHGTNPGA